MTRVDIASVVGPPKIIPFCRGTGTFDTNLFECRLDLGFHTERTVRGSFHGHYCPFNLRETTEKEWKILRLALEAVYRHFAAGPGIPAELLRPGKECEYVPSFSMSFEALENKHTAEYVGDLVVRFPGIRSVAFLRDPMLLEPRWLHLSQLLVRLGILLPKKAGMNFKKHNKDIRALKAMVCTSRGTFRTLEEIAQSLMIKAGPMGSSERWKPHGSQPWYSIEEIQANSKRKKTK